MDNHYRLGQIQRRHWDQTVKMVGYPSDDFETLLQDIKERCRGLEDLAHTLSKNISEKLIDPVITQIKKQILKLEE